MIDKIEKWWSGLNDLQKLTLVAIVFVLMMIANPFIN